MEKTGEKPIRVCLDCSISSTDLTLFVPDKQSRHGRRNLCTNCAVKRNKKQPERKDWKTYYQVRKRYGIDVDLYKQRMASSLCCEICGTVEKLCYDHDHTTMAFRGVLCNKCNRCIGQLGDTADHLRKALAYLERKI